MDPALYKAVIEGNSTLLSQVLKAELAEEDDLHHQQQSDDQHNDDDLLRIADADSNGEVVRDTLLYTAANYNNVPVVRVIRENQPTSILRSKNYREDTALHIAARHNNAEVVKYLLDWAKEIKNRDGNTALHEAVLRRHREVIEVLMESDKYLIFMKNNRRESPLYLAADRGLHVVLEKMLKVALEDENFNKKKKDLRIFDGPDGRTPLHAAIAKKQTWLQPSGPPSPIIVENKSRTDTQNICNYKGRFNTLVLVANLICRVTFPAGFTVPGGLNVDGPYKGMATLLRKPAFNVFVICNTMALYLSIVVVVNNICAQLADIHVFILVAKFSSPLLGLALIMMAVAFAAGLYSVIVKLQWLATVVLVIGSIFLFYMVYFLALINVPYKFNYLVPRYISWRFYLLICKIDRIFDNIDWLSGVKEV
ncbi:ankyrin repeat-containing protein At5g02620-like [Macadamia integrifolia]|uniref:ankyrin repeat-containing protein At5g02620-like n=1 Tax=Macadamia integrifolia TaxID=60698 RepID=UPI001C4F7FE1|nr:ankyrin repeat-containing protein At5g02620-like [Macadamia integrifolia]